jgi:hypothetical protein
LVVSKRLTESNNDAQQPVAAERGIAWFSRYFLRRRLGADRPRPLNRIVGRLRELFGDCVKKTALWVITILFFLASAYSMLSLLMVASLSGGPNYSPERAQLNANLWGSLSVGFFLFGALFAFVLWRNRKRRVT